MVLEDLPSAFVNKIVSENEFQVIVRTSTNTIDDLDAWVDEFSIKSHTKWNVQRTFLSSRTFICRKIFICHHSSYGKVPADKNKRGLSKNAGCLARLKFKIKYNSKHIRYRDPFVKEGLRGEVIISTQHTHSLVTAASLRFLPATKDVHNSFISYFNAGMTASEAAAYYKTVLEKENKSEIEKSDARFNPTKRTIQWWYQRWRKAVSVPRTGENVKVEEYNDVSINMEDTENAQDCILPLTPQQTDQEQIVQETNHLAQIASTVKELKAINKRLNNENGNREYEIFGKHVASQLSKLSVEQAIRAQEKIQHILTQSRLAEIRKNSENADYASSLHNGASPRSSDSPIYIKPESTESQQSPESTEIQHSSRNCHSPLIHCTVVFPDEEIEMTYETVSLDMKNNGP